jgi:hypothetical protein
MESLQVSSAGFETPLRVRPEGSWLLGAILSSAHILALALLPPLALPHSLELAIGIVVLLSLYRAIHTHVLLRGSRATRGLVWESSGRIVVRDGENREHEAQVSVDSFAHPWAVVLRLALSDRSRRALVLLPGCVGDDVLRQLRVRLRLATEVDERT